MPEPGGRLPRPPPLGLASLGVWVAGLGVSALHSVIQGLSGCGQSIPSRLPAGNTLTPTLREARGPPGGQAPVLAWVPAIPQVATASPQQVGWGGQIAGALTWGVTGVGGGQWAESQGLLVGTQPHGAPAKHLCDGHRGQNSPPEATVHPRGGPGRVCTYSGRQRPRPLGGRLIPSSPGWEHLQPRAGHGRAALRRPDTNCIRANGSRWLQTGPLAMPRRVALSVTAAPCKGFLA